MSLLSSSIKRPGRVDPVFQLRKSNSNSSQTSPKESRKRRTFLCSTFSLVPNMMLNKVALILLVLGLANAYPKKDNALKAVKTRLKIKFECMTVRRFFLETLQYFLTLSETSSHFPKCYHDSLRHEYHNSLCHEYHDSYLASWIS